MRRYHALWASRRGERERAAGNVMRVGIVSVSMKIQRGSHFRK